MSPSTTPCFYCGSAGEYVLDIVPGAVCEACKRKIELVLRDAQFLDNYLFNAAITYAISNPQKLTQFSAHKLKYLLH